MSTGVQPEAKVDRVFTLPEGRADELAFVARGFGAALAGTGQSPEINKLAKELFADGARQNAKAQISAAVGRLLLSAEDKARLLGNAFADIDSAKPGEIQGVVAAILGDLAAKAGDNSLDKASETLDDQKEAMKKLLQKLDGIDRELDNLWSGVSLSEAEKNKMVKAKEEEEEARKRYEANPTAENAKVLQTAISHNTKVQLDIYKAHPDAPPEIGEKLEERAKVAAVMHKYVIDTTAKRYEEAHVIKVEPETPVVASKAAEASEAGQGFLFSAQPSAKSEVAAEARTTTSAAAPTTSPESQTAEAAEKPELPSLKGVTLASFQPPGGLQLSSKAKPAETGAVLGGGSFA